jgi:uncharacterized glyoxalase superfamily protein PhnB
MTEKQAAVGIADQWRSAREAEVARLLGWAMTLDLDVVGDIDRLIREAFKSGAAVALQLTTPALASRKSYDP